MLLTEATEGAGAGAAAAAGSDVPPGLMSTRSVRPPQGGHANLFRDRALLDQLCAMGFDREQARAAISASGLSDVDGVIAHMLG